MKRILSLAVLFCAVAVSALAAAPEAALKALTLGNDKFVLEQSLAPAPLAIVIADPAIPVPAADLFGMSEARLAVVKPEGGFTPTTGIAVKDADLTAPLVVVLGLTEEAVWTVYANTLVASPDLIHAVMKGQVSAVGAVVDAQSGAVTVLGAHPELQILVGQYLLTLPSNAETEGAAEPASEAAPVTEAVAETEAMTEPQADLAPAAEEKVDTETPEAVVQEDAAPAENHAASAETAHAAADDAQAAQESGGSGFMLVLVFIGALIGAIVFMDKTVLKG